MSSRLDEYQRQIAAQLQHDYPNWVILWGPHTRPYWAFPAFTASPGTVVAAPAPRQLATRMQDTEHAAASAAAAARAHTPRKKRP